MLVLPTAGRKELATWVEGKPLAASLFPSPANPERAISPQAVNAMLHAAGLRGAHAFRHSYKVRLRRASVPEEVIRSFMGHGPANVTQAYGRMDIGEMLAAAERLVEAKP